MATQTDRPGSAAPGISQFLIQVHGEERNVLLDYAIKQGYGVDVSDFISQRFLDDGPRCAELVAWYRSRLAGVSGLVTLHGALWDLVPSSRDSKVRAATKERMNQCLDIAEALGVSWVVFHLDFFPLARDPNYFRHWAERQALFWRELLEGRSVTLLLENTWEPRPEVVRAAVDSVGMDCVGACLDAGHVHLHAQVAARHQHQVRLGDDLVEPVNRLRFLDLRDDRHVAAGFVQRLP